MQNPGIFIYLSLIRNSAKYIDDEPYWEQWQSQISLFRHICKHSTRFIHVQAYWGALGHIQALLRHIGLYSDIFRALYKSMCEIAHYGKTLVSVFQEFFASVNKTFILAGRLSTWLSFYEIYTLSWYFLISLSRSATREATCIYK